MKNVPPNRGISLRNNRIGYLSFRLLNEEGNEDNTTNEKCQKAMLN